MRPQGEVIGDNSVDADIDKAVRAADLLPETMDSGADTIVNKAKSIAKAKGLHKTGAGVEGIVYERENDDRLIGWAPRPNFHLYFHEIGTYKDYPRPHVRPAADQTEEQVIRDIENDLLGDL